MHQLRHIRNILVDAHTCTQTFFMIQLKSSRTKQKRKERVGCLFFRVCRRPEVMPPSRTSSGRASISPPKQSAIAPAVRRRPPARCHSSRRAPRLRLMRKQMLSRRRSGSGISFACLAKGIRNNSPRLGVCSSVANVLLFPNGLCPRCHGCARPAVCPVL